MDERNPKEEQEAYLAGHRAGKRCSAYALNPHPFGSHEHTEWSRGWHNANAARVSAIMQERARKAAVCHYRHGEACRCGGRGLCLDVA